MLAQSICQLLYSARFVAPAHSAHGQSVLTFVILFPGRGIDCTCSCAALHAEDVWDSRAKRTFAYDWVSTLLIDRVVKPPLQFTAPELAGSVSDAPVTGKADVFSLACVMFQVLKGQPLITAETVAEYRSMLASMHLIPAAGLPASAHVRLKDVPSPMLLPCLLDVQPHAAI